MNIREIRRQAIHFTGIAIAFFTLYINTEILATLAFLGALAMFFAGRHSKHLQKKKDVLDGPIGYLMSFERKGTEPFIGVIMFLTGIGISLFLFPQYAALSIVVLSVGDSISTLIGVHKGHHKIHYNKDKSYQGLVSGFLAASAACMLFAPWQTAVIAGASGLIIESLPLKIDDNVSVPVGVALVLTALSSFGF